MDFLSFWLSLSPPVKELPESCFSFPCHSGLSGILLFIRPHLMYLTKKDSRQAGMTDHRGEGFPTSENDRSQRAWTSCSFWLSLSLPVKNRQDPSSPCHSGLSRILLLIRSHLMYSTNLSRSCSKGFPLRGAVLALDLITLFPSIINHIFIAPFYNFSHLFFNLFHPYIFFSLILQENILVSPCSQNPGCIDNP